MVKELLPRDLGEVIASKYNFAGIYEFRIRSGMPILLNYLGEYIILSIDGRDVRLHGSFRKIEFLADSLDWRALG